MSRIVCLSFLFLAGCGGNQVGIVTGLVTLDGKPLSYAEVTFTAKEDPALGSYGTRTGADGRFVLFQDPRPGAYIKPGVYVAVMGNVSKPRKEVELAAAGNPGTGVRNPLPPVYCKKDDSPLIVEVKPGDNDFKLQLKSNP